MKSHHNLPFPYERAICYSGFREGQQPGNVYPSREQIREDLYLLAPHWTYLRLYDCDPQTDLVLDLIEQEELPFKVMLGAYVAGEMNNYGCPWGGGVYSEEQLRLNRQYNERRIHKCIALANRYPHIVNSVSVGNEACVDWTDHYVSVQRVMHFVQLVKNQIEQPVTFCENYVPWLNKLKPLGAIIDFISIHTYPVWEYKLIDDALQYTKENYYSVANTYPDKATVITEAGWATHSNGRDINPENVNEDLQKIYFDQLMEWADQEQIITYFFEAFDEPWKGSTDPLEPEKHWGLFKVDRTPKAVLAQVIGI